MTLYFISTFRPLQLRHRPRLSPSTVTEKRIARPYAGYAPSAPPVTVLSIFCPADIPMVVISDFSRLDTRLDRARDLAGDLVFQETGMREFQRLGHNLRLGRGELTDPPAHREELIEPPGDNGNAGRPAQQNRPAQRHHVRRCGGEPRLGHVRGRRDRPGQRDFLVFGGAGIYPEFIALVARPVGGHLPRSEEHTS